MSLPNGLDFNFFGIDSLRRNDLNFFHDSHILNILDAIQINSNLKFVILGDSAYRHISDPFVVCSSNGMPEELKKVLSATRETIEWNFGQLKTLSNTLDTKRVLKIGKMDINSMIKSACVIRNAFVCMNGCQTATYFNCTPPNFENWISGNF